MMFPDLDELLALRADVRGIQFNTRRASRSTISGGHGSVHRGRGIEFQEVRQYVMGDDPRMIDWRVTARLGRAYTKLFREERERPVWLLVDLTSTMFFGTRRQLKSTLAIHTAALLAWSAALESDRVGGVVVSDSSVKIIPPRAREAGVIQLLLALTQMQPRQASPSRGAGLTDGLQSLLPLVRPGSLVLAISDFATIGAGSEGDWMALGRHNDVRFFWITDPLERRGLPNGRFRVWLPERPLTINGASVRAAWQARWREREDRTNNLALQIGAPLIQLDTSESLKDLLTNVLAGRPIAA
jgi:uncharacterized protein (DUF58 family)